jgi:hypothetical protein
MSKRLISVGVCTLLALALVTSAGCAGGLIGNSERATTSGAVSSPAPAPAASGAHGGVDNAPATTGEAQKSSGASADRLVIMNAAMQLRVVDLAASIASIRALTKAVGGSVSQLTVTSDSESPAPDAEGSTSATARIPGPASASLTLRVPAQRLTDVEAKVAGLGRLISQSSNESDVTQQHIDMSARLRNLRAEEARLRGLLARAGSVSELLAVERELSRVRGDIESMQAQLTYLEGQAAMATLTVALDQPGPVVRPSTGGWGLVDSVTTGVQAAAALVRQLITGLIAISPLIVLGALVWWLISWRARRRRALRDARPAQAGPPSGPDTADPVVPEVESPSGDPR